jgi:hypothetical protein
MNPAKVNAREAGIFTLLDELTEVLNKQIRMITPPAEIKGVISEWINKKMRPSPAS